MLNKLRSERGEFFTVFASVSILICLVAMLHPASVNPFRERKAAEKCESENVANCQAVVEVMTKKQILTYIKDSAVPVTLVGPDPVINSDGKYVIVIPGEEIVEDERGG
ncbi:MAG: hypothetical protein KAJ18_08630 [Candidatus Omnitrophica bacterium]|nr:hypothetical protein [Candidatus Omnitrophota bacterium]